MIETLGAVRATYYQGLRSTTGQVPCLHLSIAAQNQQTDEAELRPPVYCLPKASSELLASLSKVINSEAEAMWEFF